MTVEKAKYDFFISYNKKDESWAVWIDWHLRKAGYSTIMQKWDFRPGQNFVMQMDLAIKDSKRTIIVLSQNFLDSEFTQPEWAAAFKCDPKGKNSKLIPVKVGECKPEGDIFDESLCDPAYEGRRGRGDC